MNTNHTHQDLIERCKRGHRSAQFELYRLYSRAVYNTLLRMVRHAHDAEDLLQSTFIEVFTKIDTFRYESSLGAWIKRIAINKAINFLKSRRVVFQDIDKQGEVPEKADEDGPLELTVERVNHAIRELPDGYRMVFTLYALEGYDHEEIGEILGISPATSKSQYSRAKARLRELLKTNGHEEGRTHGALH
jgi:RNA polymerase sigma-70 factor (ECF subfamily)